MKRIPGVISPKEKRTQTCWLIHLAVFVNNLQFYGGFGGKFQVSKEKVISKIQYYYFEEN